MRNTSQPRTASDARRESGPTEKASPVPVNGGYVDRTSYRTVHFLGASLHETLLAASTYLRRLEEALGYPPHILCVHDEFSSADADTNLTWQFTVVLGEPD